MAGILLPDPVYDIQAHGQRNQHQPKARRKQQDIQRVVSLQHAKAGQQILQPENTSEKDSPDCGRNPDHRNNTPKRHLHFFPHQDPGQAQNQALPQITEHDSEKQRIGNRHKKGWVNFPIGGQPVHFNKHLKIPDHRQIFQAGRRLEVLIVFRIFRHQHHILIGVEHFFQRL